MGSIEELKARIAARVATTTSTTTSAASVLGRSADEVLREATEAAEGLRDVVDSFNARAPVIDGGTFRRMLRRIGLTQRQAATFARRNHHTINAWVRGRRPPDQAIVHLLAVAHGLRWPDLCDCQAEPHASNCAALVIWRICK